MEEDHLLDTRVREALHALGVPYEVVACDPELADTAAFCESYGFAMEDSANTIVVVGKADPRRYVACVVLATTRLDVNGIVRQRLAVRRASFASGDETVEVTGMSIGGVTPFGLPPTLPVWVDRRVVARRRLVFGGGSRACKVVAGPDVLHALPSVEVVDGLAKEA